MGEDVAGESQPLPHRIRTRSGVSPIEAGYGLVHSETIVATTADELMVMSPTARIELRVGNRATSGPTADLGLAPGTYDGTLSVLEGETVWSNRMTRLILVDPGRVCRRFGARYGSLEYDIPVVVGRDGRKAPWASLWKTNEVADIVVDFDAPYKLVLWRGMSYAPAWAMDNMMTSNFFAETLEPGVYRDCCEMMSDRECRYVHARVVHSTSARVVIHWRYALNDPTYAICRNQWADEMLYVYPDGVAVRNVTVHLDPSDEAVWQTCPDTGRRVPCSMINGPPGKRVFNDMELITVNAPGATSEGNTPLDALTLLDSDAFCHNYRWPHPPDFGTDPLPALKEYIFRMNYRYRAGVFVAGRSPGMQVRLQENTGMRYDAGAMPQDDRWVGVPDLPTLFSDYVHWPVSRGYGTTPLTDVATYEERPTHTFLGYANNAPVEVRDDGAVTWVWLCGMAPRDDGLLRRRVKSWTQPTAIDGAQYDVRQGVYVVDDLVDGHTLVVRGGSAVVRPTFVLRNFEIRKLGVLVDSAPVEADRVASGIERSLDGVQTVVTIRQDIARGSTIRFVMQG